MPSIHQYLVINHALTNVSNNKSIIYIILFIGDIADQSTKINENSNCWDVDLLGILYC